MTKKTRQKKNNKRRSRKQSSRRRVMRQKGGVKFHNTGDEGYFIVTNNNHPDDLNGNIPLSKQKVSKTIFEKEYERDIGDGGYSNIRSNRTITYHIIGGAHYLYYEFNNNM